MASPSDHTSYDVRYFDQLIEIEDKHFWFRSRNLVIESLVKQIIQPFQPSYRVLEVGCGTGNTLRVLDRTCDEGLVVGMDLFREGLHYARERVTCPLVQGDLNTPPFKNTFDLIGLFDVLEHIADDSGVLQALYQLTSPGGVLLITVPAHMALWSYFDEASHHCRRYEYAELQTKLRQAGYSVEFLTPYIASTLPIVWLKRRFAPRLAGDRETTSVEKAHELTGQELKIVPVINRLFLSLLSLEARWIGRFRSLPMGSSLLAVCRKP